MLSRRRIVRLLSRAAAVLLALVLGGLFIGCCAFSGPRYQGPVSDHFD